MQGPGDGEIFLPTSSSVSQTSPAVESLTSNVIRISDGVVDSATDTYAASASTEPFAPAYSVPAVGSGGDNVGVSSPDAERGVPASSGDIGTNQEGGNLAANALPKDMAASFPSSPAPSTASRARMMSMSPTVDPAVLAMQLDKESKGVLGKLRKDA